MYVGRLRLDLGTGRNDTAAGRARSRWMRACLQGKGIRRCV